MDGITRSMLATIDASLKGNVLAPNPRRPILSMLHRGLIGGALLAGFAAGCGGSSPSGSQDGTKAQAPPPRPGEDTMKDAMQKLMQKGKVVPGVPRGPAKGR
jgi:hypothetical protein